MASLNPETMDNWSNRIKTINENASSIISTIEQNIKDTDNYWQGTSSESYIENQTDLVTTAKEFHENMGALADYLVETKITYINE